MYDLTTHSPAPFRVSGSTGRCLADRFGRPVLIGTGGATFGVRYHGTADGVIEVPTRHNLALMLQAPRVLLFTERLLALGGEGGPLGQVAWWETQAHLREACDLSRDPAECLAAAVRTAA